MLLIIIKTFTLFQIYVYQDNRTTTMTQNILQPQQDTNSQEFMNSLCEALLHTTNNDNTARMQAEQYMT